MGKRELEDIMDSKQTTVTMYYRATLRAAVQRPT